MIFKTKILLMNLFKWKLILISIKIKINKRIKIFLSIKIIQNNNLTFNSRMIKMLKLTLTRV